jgi:hypothetical protein
VELWLLLAAIVNGLCRPAKRFLLAGIQQLSQPWPLGAAMLSDAPTLRFFGLSRHVTAM